jgi:DNA recombination protein RmuC
MTAVLAVVSFVLAVAATVAIRRLVAARSALAAAERELELNAARLADREEAHARRLADLERATAEKVRLVTANRTDFVREMEAVSAKALQGATEQVTRLAQEARRVERATATGDAKLRTEELRRVVSPITDQLKKVETQVEQLQLDRTRTQGTVRELFETVTREVDKLRLETNTLVSALKRPQVRGAWGEMQLRNIVKAAGMTDHVDFHAQATVDGGDDGRFRPDLTVHLPTDRDIVVDSKVPLEAYLAAMEAPDDAQRDAQLDRHAQQVRAHLDALGTKAYQRRLERSADFVVCFLPNEACYVAALDRDPQLLQHGADRHVLIATPTTLLALLHATFYGWQQAAIERSAEEVAAAAKELYKRCGTFADHFAKIGRQLDSATGAYNHAVGSFEGRILPQLRRIEQIDAASARTIATPAMVDTAPRKLAAAESAPPPPPPREIELLERAVPMSGA